jgi:hypothetical protein
MAKQPAPPEPAKQFPPSVKKRIINDCRDGKVEIDVPDGIIAHLTRKCGGNVHDRRVVDVTSGSFEKETESASNVARNAADLENVPIFQSAYRDSSENIPHTPNNWICYNFKQRRIVPSHYAIRTYWGDPGGGHLKTWLVEMSADGKNWREVAREEDNEQLNGGYFTGTFAVAGGEECCFIRLVNIGRNHYGDDQLAISAWEIFGTLVDNEKDPSSEPAHRIAIEEEEDLVE